MKQQFAGRDIAPLKYIILIPSANQFLTLNAVWLAEKQRILIL